MHDVVAKRGGKDVAIYNPTKALQEIFVAPAVEKSLVRKFKKNGDPFVRQQLIDVVEKKVIGQAEYVVWRDGVVSRGGDGSNQHRRRAKVSERKPLLPDIDPGKVTVFRWRKWLCVPRKNKKPTKIDRRKLKAALIEAVQKCLRDCEKYGEVDSQLVQQSLSNEHYTPEQYLAAAHVVLGGIDLDPASNAKANRIVKAARFFTARNNGLTKEWRGKVWLNPPYGELVGKFVGRFFEEQAAGRVTAGIMLVNAHCTDTEWFQPLFDGMLCFTNHRINFYGDDDRSGSTHGSVFVYFGDNREAFAREFAQFGAVVVRA